MAKITAATFKSFVKKNRAVLHVRCESHFDGMTDCVETNREAAFKPAREALTFHSNNLGIAGVWLVGNSRDWFSAYSDEHFEGISFSNCCGSGTIAIPKAAPITDPKHDGLDGHCFDGCSCLVN